MAAAFSITTGTNAIRLDAERRAVAVFTVVNETGRPVRARASVSPFEPTPREWFSIQDEAERLFPLDGAEAFTVKIAVPADAPAGRQDFRLDVVSVERPDTEWAHGPAVGFEVAPPPVKPVPPPPKGYVESLLGGVGGGLIGGLAAFLVGLLLLIVAHSQPLQVLGSQFFSNCVPFFFPFFACNVAGPLGWSTLVGEALIGVVPGGAVGIILLLVRRGIGTPEPWRTALPFAIIVLVLGSIVATLVFRVLTALAPQAQVVLLVVLLLLAAAAAALAGRAYARFRSLGTI